MGVEASTHVVVLQGGRGRSQSARWRWATRTTRLRVLMVVLVVVAVVVIRGGWMIEGGQMKPNEAKCLGRGWVDEDWGWGRAGGAPGVPAPFRQRPAPPAKGQAFAPHAAVDLTGQGPIGPSYCARFDRTRSGGRSRARGRTI